MRCQAGQDVYVEADQSYTFPYNLYAAGMTSFTGVKLCQPCGNYVAFSAILSPNVTTPSLEDDLVFDNVLLNLGGAYVQPLEFLLAQMNSSICSLGLGLVTMVTATSGSLSMELSPRTIIWQLKAALLRLVLLGLQACPQSQNVPQVPQSV